MTEFIKLTGKANFAKVYPENRDMEGFEGAYVDCDGAYTIDIELDDISLEKLKNSGSKVKGSDKGYHRFKRKHAVYNKDGDVIEDFSGPPQVVGEDGQELTHETMIGNGSVVEVAITVTPDKKKPSIVYTRLEGVKVLELVEYNPEGGGQRELPF